MTSAQRCRSLLSLTKGGHPAHPLYLAATPPMGIGEDPAVYVARALAEMRRVHHAGNFTYLWAFDRRIALPDALPYPKVAA